MLLYVDIALVISENARHILDNKISKYFTMKPGSVGPPKIHLGGHMRKITLENGVKAWGFSSSQYVQAALNNVEYNLKKKTTSSLSKHSLPYRLSTDLSST